MDNIEIDVIAMLTTKTKQFKKQKHRNIYNYRLRKMHFLTKFNVETQYFDSQNRIYNEHETSHKLKLYQNGHQYKTSHVGRGS